MLRRYSPRNDCKKGICLCERSEAIPALNNFAITSNILIKQNLALRSIRNGLGLEMEFDAFRLVESFAGVCREILLRPRDFFRNLPREGAIGNPLLFLFICVFLSCLVMANMLNGDYRLFLVLFTANLLSDFIMTGILHGLVKKAFSGQASIAATFRVFAYSSLTDLAAWIPFVGTIATFYGLYLVFLGLQEIHQLRPRQAGIAVIAITALSLGAGIAVLAAGKDLLPLAELGLLPAE